MTSLAAVYLRVTYLAGIKFDDSIENKLWLWERRYKGVKLAKAGKKDGNLGLTVTQWEEQQLAEMEKKERKHYKKFAESLYGLPLQSTKKKKEKKHEEKDSQEPLDPIAQWERQQLLLVQEKEKQNRKQEKRERKELREKLQEQKLQRREKKSKKALNRRKKWPISLIDLEEALLSISPKITQLPLVSFIQALKKENQTKKSWASSNAQKEKLWLKVCPPSMRYHTFLFPTRRRSSTYAAWN